MLDDLHDLGGKAVDECIDQHDVQQQNHCDTAEAAYWVLLFAPKLTRAPWPLHTGRYCRKLPFDFRTHLYSSGVNRPFLSLQRAYIRQPTFTSDNRILFPWL